jgi:hypothetical protein
MCKGIVARLTGAVEPGVQGGSRAVARNRPTGSLLFVLVLCAAIALLASCHKSDAPARSARELVNAFVAADAKRAKAVTVSEQWDRIDEWMKGRQPFECLEGEWDATGTGGSGFHDTVSNEWNFGFLYQCASQRTPYCLNVDDILVKETADGWKVYDWGKICEAPELGYKCAELCYRLDDDS